MKEFVGTDKVSHKVVTEFFYLLVAILFVLILKKYNVYSFTSWMGYIFFVLFYYVIRNWNSFSREVIRENCRIKVVIPSVFILFVLGRYYTFYNNKGYLVIWALITYMVLILSEMLVPINFSDIRITVVAVLLAGMYSMGWTFTYANLDNGWGKLLFIFGMHFLCCFLLFLKVLLILDKILGQYHFCLRSGRMDSRKFFAVIFLINLLIMLPVFCIYYPGILCIDGVGQFKQILGMMKYSNHHPWCSTMVMKLFYNIGFAVTGSVNGGVAAYTLFSIMLAMASISYAITFFYKKGLPWGWMLLVEAMYLIDPIKQHHSAVIWKDNPFSSMLLMLSVLLADYHKSKKWGIACGIVVFCSCAFRNNGLYIVFIIFMLMLFFMKEDRKFLCKVFIPAIALYMFVVKAIIPMNGVEKESLVDSLSIPLQQIAYTVCQGGTISEEDYNLLNQVADIEKIKARYESGRSDPIKGLANENREIIEQNKMEYLKLYIRMGIHNPYCYIMGFVEQTKGYWYPTKDYPVRTEEGIDGEEIGVEKHPLIFSEKIAGDVQHRIWKFGAQTYPKYFCLGIQTYLCLIIMALTRKERYYCLAAAPALFNIATLLIATPLYGEFRYAYSAYLFIPFGIGLLLLQCGTRRKIEDNVSV